MCFEGNDKKSRQLLGRKVHLPDKVLAMPMAVMKLQTSYETDQIKSNQMWIYIAHCQKIFNALMNQTVLDYLF